MYRILIYYDNIDVVNMQYEFVGDVKVEGMKKDEVKSLLVKLLEEYIISPVVTVKITGYNSKIVYVVGEVGDACELSNFQGGADDSPCCR